MARTKVQYTPLNKTSVDNLAETLRTLEGKHGSYELVLEGERHELREVRLFETATPVRERASRGNVYTEGRKSYRMEAGVDPAICDRLSRTMLGPSSRFGGLHIRARVGQRLINMEGGLLNMSRTGGMVRLNIGIVDVR